LAQYHDITVLTSRYRNSVDRVEDGVRYLHIGLPWGYYLSILTYFLVLPFATQMHHADLVVEDFAAPFSSCLSPLWTRKKLVALVQWLNAKEKSKQYLLPFWIIETIGLRLHHHYIAVSSTVADAIHARNPKATVDVIGNGVPGAAFSEKLTQKREDIVFLGRLEREQKGLDLLLEAYALIAPQTKANLILIGDGPAERWLRTRIAELGLAHRVKLTGRVDGKQKHAALARAKVVAMPSRFETFGMVAVEAFATGTPVVAFDIACLHEVIPPRLGTIVPAYDVPAYAKTLLSFLDDTSSPADLAAIRLQRREFARRYDWDTLAATQQKVFERVANSAQPVGGSR
ncbi:MAG TPA: glycosyltransferase family 4 protein, partial [Candidatus Polarisedimenticolaceae bacterium]|nr:glycosyltransferase family 4 protein [Candidatus Polarisedimenticolaceae bacterium]